MCQQQKIIPDRMKLSLQLEKAADNFALIHNNVAGANITITRARWHVRRVELTESAGRALSQILLKENALYSFDRVRVHQQTFRTMAFDFDSLLAGAVKLAHRSGGPEGLLFSMADFCGGYGLMRLTSRRTSTMGIGCRHTGGT